MGEVVIGGCLGHSGHEVVEFQSVGDRRKTASKTLTLGVGRADFGLLKELVSNAPWESAFGDAGVHECWSLLKSAGAGNSKVSEVKQTGQQTGLAEQGSSTT